MIVVLSDYEIDTDDLKYILKNKSLVINENWISEFKFKEITFKEVTVPMLICFK
jgi:hypothetical protein